MSIPLLVRHLGVARFGEYVAVLSVINIAALASDLGLQALALREWSSAAPGERAGLLRMLLGLRLAAASLGALAAIVFSVVAGYRSALVAGTAVAAIGLFAQVFGDFALVTLAGGLRFGRVATVELTRSALGTAGIVVLVAAGAGIVPFFAAYAFAAIVAALLAIWLARGSATLVPSLRPAAWRPLLADTAAYAAAAAVYVVYFRVVMLVASIEAGARQAGLFATAFRVIEFAAAVAGVVAATVTPVLARASRDDPERLARGAAAVTRAALVAGTGAALTLGLAAPTVMDLIGGARTAAAATVLRIEAPTVAATFVAFGMGAVLLVTRRYRALLLANAWALAVALGAALILVPDHGANGAAVAALAGELTLVILQAVALARTVPVARRLARPLMVVAGAAGVAIAVFALVPLPNAAATAIAVVVYAALVAVLRELPPELGAIIRRRAA